MSSIKAGLYIRVSTEDQVNEGYSLDNQKRRLYEFCQQNNYEVYKLYSDEGISGHSITKRKAFQELLKDAKAKKFDIVVAYKTDRLSRNLLDLLIAKQELDNANVELVLSDESIDTKDDTGIAMFSIMGAFAELERKKITERMMTGKRQKILNENKMPGIGTIPFGYKYINNEYMINEDEAQYVRQIFNLFESGMSSYQVSRYFIDRDIKLGKKDNYFSSGTLTRLVQNPIYKGFGGISYSGKRYSEKLKNDSILIKCDNIEPIISEEQWDRVNQTRKTKFGSKKPASDEFIFLGVLYCNECGWKMRSHISNYTKTKKDGSPVQLWYSYRCTQRDYLTGKHSCSISHISSSKVDGWFRDFLDNLNITSSTIKATIKNTNELEKQKIRLEKNYQELQRKQKILLQKLIDGVISDDSYKEMNDELLNNLNTTLNTLNGIKNEIEKSEENTKEIEQLKTKVLAIKKIGKKWDMLTPDNKKLVVDTFIKAIYVNKDGIVKIEFK